MENVVRIIGGGLAGAEAAWQLARRGIAVELFEMRPQRMTEAHAGSDLGELVCSNSLRSDLPSAPAGLLKAEMRCLDSLIIRCADRHRVPAGSALAVDRANFSRGFDRNGRGVGREYGSFAKKFGTFQTMASSSLPPGRSLRRHYQKNWPLD